MAPHTKVGKTGRLKSSANIAWASSNPDNQNLMSIKLFCRPQSNDVVFVGVVENSVCVGVVENVVCVVENVVFVDVVDVVDVVECCDVGWNAALINDRGSGFFSSFNLFRFDERFALQVRNDGLELKWNKGVVIIILANFCCPTPTY